MSNTLYRYSVKGNRNFPIDMLRYDVSYPADSESAATISLTFEPGQFDGDVTIFLLSQREPTAGRWSSFGWTVGKVERIRR